MNIYIYSFIFLTSPTHPLNVKDSSLANSKGVTIAAAAVAAALPAIDTISDIAIKCDNIVVEEEIYTFMLRLTARWHDITVIQQTWFSSWNCVFEPHAGHQLLTLESNFEIVENLTKCFLFLIYHFVTCKRIHFKTGYMQ